jgi:hypothetical protein
MADLSALEKQYGLPNGLLSLVSSTESNGNPNAISPKGALGQFQFMPSTAQQYGIDPLDPDQAASGAAQMYGDLLKKYNGDLPSALGAYNWGQGNVDRKGLENAPPETQNYIQKIMSGIGNAIIPSAQASDLSSISDDQLKAIAGQQDLSSISDEELQKIANSTSLPSKSDYSRGSIQSQELGPLPVKQPSTEEVQNQNALSSVMGQQSPLARLTAYGANAISEIPGLKEGGSALAALAGQGEGKTFGERYANLESAQQAMRKAGEVVNPDLTNVGKISGFLTGLGLGGAGLAKAVPEATATALGSYAKAHPYISASGANAGIGGLYGLADGTDTQSRLTGAAENAGINAALAVPLTFAVGKLAGPLASKTIEDIAPTVTQKIPTSSYEMGGLANQAYKQADELGGTLAPKFTNKFIEYAKNVVPQTEAGKIVSGEDSVTQLVNRMQGLKDKPLSLQSAQEVDESLSSLIDKNMDAGRLTKEGKKIYDIQTFFRDLIRNPSEGDIVGGKEGFDAWRQGQAYWAQMAKMRDIENIMNRASLSDNPQAVIRSGIRTILTNKARLNGYSADEIKALQNAAKTGIVGGVLRMFGGRLNPMITMGSGFAIGHIPGAVAGGLISHATSSVARNAATSLQMGKAQKVLNTLAKNTTPKTRIKK